MRQTMYNKTSDDDSQRSDNHQGQPIAGHGSEQHADFVVDAIAMRQHIADTQIRLDVFLFAFFTGSLTLIRKIAKALGPLVQLLQFLERVGLAVDGLDSRRWV